MRVKAKMYYSKTLEYVVESYFTSYYSKFNYFSKNVDKDNRYNFLREDIHIMQLLYPRKVAISYKNEQNYVLRYTNHIFSPEIFLIPTRPKTRFMSNSNEVRKIVEEVFILMMKSKLPDEISINILPFKDFKVLHSKIGIWHEGILGFSINGVKKDIFVRKNNLDALMLVLGHEIGHVLTETLPNKHDEEAKAFAFSIEWIRTIKKYNIANLGLNIKDIIDFKPARNGLHDIAFSFINHMIRNKRKMIELYYDLVKRYISIFDIFYC